MKTSTSMDRTYWLEEVNLLLGEKVIVQQTGVRLYDGEEKVSFFLLGSAAPLEIDI